MSAETAVAHVVLRERQARDRGWWDHLRTSFHPDAPVFLSWLDGTATQFVDGSKAMSESGLRPLHRLAPPVVRVVEQRAVVELGASVAVTVEIHGVEADLVSYSRLLYQADQLYVQWKIASLTAIYEADTLTPAMPGSALWIDLDAIDLLRKPYRFLAYHQHLRGGTVPDDMYGDDRPDEVSALYEHLHAWLRSRGQPAGRPDRGELHDRQQ